MPNITDLLWTRYRETGDASARNELLRIHLGLVHHLARQCAARLPDTVELDDLISAGTIGLVHALADFEPERGLEFSTYATPRIRGAILDELRHADWAPRSVRRKQRRLAAVTAELESRHGRPPTPQEMADALAIDLPTFWRWQQEIQTATVVSLDQPPEPAAGDMPRLQRLDTLAVATEAPDDLEREETAALLKRALEQLSEKEYTVLALYYYENLTMRQIAEVLHLTESRISQIHTKALQRLRAYLHDFQEEL
jgi:RNA polymerase sigma factor for flagellar operon FliA